MGEMESRLRNQKMCVLNPTVNDWLSIQMPVHLTPLSFSYQIPQNKEIPKNYFILRKFDSECKRLKQYYII